MTFSKPSTHAFVTEHLHLSRYLGQEGDVNGPRYCPSFEAKVVRFPDRSRCPIWTADSAQLRYMC